MRRRTHVPQSPVSALSEHSYSSDRSPLSPIERVIRRPPPIEVAKSRSDDSESTSVSESKSKSLVKADKKWVYVGAILMTVSVVLIYIWIRRSRKNGVGSSSEEHKSSRLAPSQEQFDRLLQAALAQEKEFKALKQQHTTLIQAVRERDQQQVRPAPAGITPVTASPTTSSVRTKPALEIIDEDPNEVDDEPPRLIFTTTGSVPHGVVHPFDMMGGLSGLFQPPIRSGGAVVEEIGDDEKQLDSELEDTLDQELDRELSAEDSAVVVPDEIVEEVKEEVKEEVSSSEPPELPPPLSTITTSVPTALVFDDPVTTIKPPPKPPTKRTPRAKKNPSTRVSGS